MALGHHRVARSMMKGGHGPIKWLPDSDCGAFDHASHAPQSLSYNYYKSLRIYSTVDSVTIWRNIFAKRLKLYIIIIMAHVHA